MTTPIGFEEYEERIDAICSRVLANSENLELLEKNLVSDLSQQKLNPLFHSIRSRVKDIEHLRSKLFRKAAEARAADAAFDIDENNVFERINDLVGVRLLHLHTDQFALIKVALEDVFSEHRYTIEEGPIAKVWDDEYTDFFEGLGVKTERNSRMYTSVHYVIQPNRRTKFTAELQVRTLAEELWGEVDHSINYPAPTTNHDCRDQIKVLARVTSSCTRLVDSIFRSHARKH